MPSSRPGGQPQPLLESKTVLVPASMSHDGKQRAFFEPAAPNGWIHTVEITEEDGRIAVLTPEDRRAPPPPSTPWSSS